MPPFLLLSAMPEESARLHAALPHENRKENMVLGRKVYHYRAHQTEFLLSTTSMGKVSAAAHVSALIGAYQPGGVVFFGLAGGIDRAIQNTGDLVIASGLFQHDLDCSPLPQFKKYEVPELGQTIIEPDPALSDAVAAAARLALENHPTSKTCRGLIATGDRFITDGAWVKSMHAENPGLRAVEMEGAAVAQVCKIYQTPFAVMRGISDFADELAASEFNASLFDIPCDHLTKAILNLIENFNHLGEVAC